jgi:hypothetical protein
MAHGSTKVNHPYFKLGTSTRRLTRLLSLLSFSGGPVAHDLWFSPGTDEKVGYYLKVYFVQDPLLSERKGSHDPEPVLSWLPNPKFVYEELI